jgi:chromosome segregation ATPase
VVEERRLERLEEKLDRVMETSVRSEEQLALVYRLLEQHDARAVKAVEEAARAHDRVDALEALASVPLKWLKALAAVAGAVTALFTAWTLLKGE